MIKLTKIWLLSIVLICLCAVAIMAGTDAKVNQDVNTTVQNEPSITINKHYTSDPLNIVVGYNDIGTSLGISWSPDGGATWNDVQLPLVYSYGTGDPSVASDNNGNVYACFLSYDAGFFYGKSGIFVCKSTDGGRNWGPAVPVDTLLWPGSGGPVPFADKCMMTVDTNSSSPYVNNIYVGWQRDNTDAAHSDIYFARSTNGGASFSIPIKINDDVLGTAFAEGAFPFVGADGDVYITWYDSYYQGHEPGSMYVDKSTNGGLTFGTDIKVADFDMPPKYTYGNSCFRAKSFPSAAADPHNSEKLYITYISDPDGYFDKRLCSGHAPGVPPAPGSDIPVIDREGSNVYVAYRDNRNGGGTDIYFNRSTDNGQTWNLPDIGPLDNGDTPGANTSWMQQLASTGSYVYCAWEDYRLGTNAHIYFNRSLNNGQTWQTDVFIDGGGAFTSSTPAIACVGSYVYVAWSDNRNGMNDIYLNVSSNYGQTWGTPRRVDLGDTPGAFHSVQPRLVCTGNYVHCMWLDERTGTFQTYYNYSANNGTTWQSSSIQLCTGTGYTCNIPPFGGLECAGTFVYACWTDDRDSAGTQNLYFASSTNNGLTWNADFRINTPGGYCNAPYLDYEGNNVYIAWEDDRLAPGYFIWDVYFSYSNNNGATFSSDTTIDHLPGIPAVAVRLESEGQYVYAAWLDSRRFGMVGMGDIYFNRSADSGTTWQTEQQLNLGTVVAGLQYNLPVISAGNGYVNVVWPDPRVWGLPNIYTNYSSDNGATWLNGPDEADVFCVRSTDGGMTWSSPVTVNDDGTTWPQVLPWVVVKENGTVDISYYDFRFTPINPGFPGAELRLAVSMNGAVSFMPSFAIQDTVVTPMTDWVGEYNGMAVLDSFVYTVFTDFEQSGNSDIYMDKTANPTTGPCQGECGDANNDGDVNVSDAVYIINYVFVGGGEPQPVLACGDANDDGTVNVSDAVYIINYVFVGGGPPSNCSPGSPEWYNGDCCVFTP
jgi:hypothetical protein